MRFGLPPLAIERIQRVFAEFPEIEKATLYGSRATGTFNPGSDIDLTLFGASLNSDLRAKIASRLDDLLLPYTIDLSLYDEIAQGPLRDHIKRVGVNFYEQTPPTSGKNTLSEEEFA